jgi:hypothetical protein
MTQEKDVTAAIEIVIDEIHKQLDLINQKGAESFSLGNYQEAQAVLEQVKRVKDFQKKVIALKIEWESYFKGEKVEMTSQTNPIQENCVSKNTDKIAYAEELDEPAKRLMDAIFGEKQPVSKEIQNSPFHQTNIPNGFVPLSSIRNAKGTKPTCLKLPDKTIINVRYWSDVLRICIKFAMDKNHDIPIPLPDVKRKNVHLLGIICPEDGLSYDELMYQGRQIYSYLNYDANNCVVNAVYILKQVPKEFCLEPVAVRYS